MHKIENIKDKINLCLSLSPLSIHWKVLSSLKGYSTVRRSIYPHKFAFPTEYISQQIARKTIANMTSANRHNLPWSASQTGLPRPAPRRTYTPNSLLNTASEGTKTLVAWAPVKDLTTLLEPTRYPGSAGMRKCGRAVGLELKILHRISGFLILARQLVSSPRVRSFEAAKLW